MSRKYKFPICCTRPSRFPIGVLTIDENIFISFILYLKRELRRKLAKQMIFTQILSILLLPLVTCFKFRSYSPKVSHVAMGYIDDLAAAMMAKGGKRCQVGITTVSILILPKNEWIVSCFLFQDSWNIGRGKFKSYLSVYKLPSAIEKLNIQTCSHAMWEVARGPHYDDLQALFESYWVPDLMSTKNMILDYDLVILPDPTIAKYMVEAYYEKEFKVAAKIADYKKKANKPYGNFESFPPNERYEYERIMNLSKQKWIRKFPPLATCGEEAYMRIRNHAQASKDLYCVTIALCALR